jgi:hypothetical protein
MSRNCQGLFIPRTPILLDLGEMGLKFFITRWVPHELSAKLKVKMVKICKRCWIFWKSSICDKRIMSLRVTNARFIEIIIIVDNSEQILRQWLIESKQ